MSVYSFSDMMVDVASRQPSSSCIQTICSVCKVCQFKRLPASGAHPILMRCFEKLVLHPSQSGPSPVCFTSQQIHRQSLLFTLLENDITYVRMLFVYFSSAFNTIPFIKLIGNINAPGLVLGCYITVGC